ncbi:MAG: mannose-6-phosphate isomerase [Isosphaeraceae bacterium]|nr:MAG: mannose-6-phosphate isomerase [Isosphaeraceae bacterium]
MADFLGPLTFEPILRRLIWGGRRLGTLLGKPIGPGDDYAESWEIADHRDAISRVDRGPFAGQSLRELIAARPQDILGQDRSPESRFPLLIKFLDARQTLSVQVHPDDRLGAELANDQGKTEAWIILHADPGARIYAGLRAGVDRQALVAALGTGDVEPLLHWFEPQIGDCVFIPAGTVHAIGAGIVLAEIQQMSDATFRLYDWGRLGSDGRPRALHIDEALRSIDFGRGPVDPVRPVLAEQPWGASESLVECPYFRVDRWRLETATQVGQSDRFTILIGMGGRAWVSSSGGEAELGLGRTVLLPAAGGRFRVEAERSALLLVVQAGSLGWTSAAEEG